MAVAYVEIEDRYIPKTSTEPIVVSALIGNGQQGAYLIFLNKDLKGNNKEAKLGKKETVAGKRTLVSATVVDILDETNWTSLTVFVKEGINVTQYGPYSKQVATHLDTVCYLIKILNA